MAGIRYTTPVLYYTKSASVTTYIKTNSSDQIPTRINSTITTIHTAVYVYALNDPMGWVYGIVSGTSGYVYIKASDVSTNSKEESGTHWTNPNRYYTLSNNVPYYSLDASGSMTKLSVIPAANTNVYVYAIDDPSGWALGVPSGIATNRVYIKLSDLSVDPTSGVSNAYSTYTQTISSAADAPVVDNPVTIEAQLALYEEWINNEYVISGTDTVIKDSSTLLSNMVGILGAPYQFPSWVDPKAMISANKESAFGTYYLDRIVNRIPLFVMAPGKSAFMADFKSTEKLNILEQLISFSDNTTLTSMINKTGKYYTFEYDQVSYWQYVNGMAHACAAYLGISNSKITLGNKQVQLEYADWSTATNGAFDSLLLSSKNYVSWYVDAVSTRSESFSNSTNDSSLAQKVNGYSDTAAEIQFLMGDVVAEKVNNLMNSGTIQALQGEVSKIADKYLSGSPIFKDLSKEFSVIASGGKLLFPKIYSNSDYSSSFDVSIKLRCPNPDILSWYVDILIPVIHAIAFVMPKTPEGSVNGYVSPFLVRAFYQGIFSCDMGIVTNLSLSKGKEGSWTMDGLPTEVDISMTITDLYEVMAMSNPNNVSDFLGNTCFINYLATMCGVNINQPDIMRSIELWGTMTKNKIKDKYTLKKWWSYQTQQTRNNILRKYSAIFPG